MRRTIALLIVVVVCSPFAAQSQTRKHSSKTSSKTTSSATKSTEVVQAAKTRVADQIKNLTRFIYVLGGVAKGIEQTDAAISKNQASPAIVEQARKSKDVVNTSLRSVREGLDKLEIDFRTTTELQRYYISLAGVAAGAANAEDLAAAGQYDRAGRSLLDVVNRLTDVLRQMT